MKKLLLLVCIVLTAVSEIPAQEVTPHVRCAQCIKEDDRVTAVVLANWLAMVGHVVKIAQDPHNSHHVGNEISQILHGVANVVQEVTRRGGNTKLMQDFLMAAHELLATVPPLSFTCEPKNI